MSVQKPSVEFQMRFGADGFEIDEQTETDLADWGFVEKTQDRETRIEEPRASEFGKDDRQTVRKSRSEQESLFVDVEQDQRTLGGERAAGKAKF